MKLLHIIIILTFAVIAFSCNSNNKDSENTKSLSTEIVKNTKSAGGQNNSGELPKMVFEETTHDFGKIIQGEKVAFNYYFTNTGELDLVIAKVSTSCGCTVGNYPKKPVEPGERAKIEVVFDSKSKKGFQNKTVTVLANTQPNRTKLYIKGVVTMPEKN